MAGRDLGEADLACDFRRPFFVERRFVAMHECDCDGPNAVFKR